MSPPRFCTRTGGSAGCAVSAPFSFIGLDFSLGRVWMRESDIWDLVSPLLHRIYEDVLVGACGTVTHKKPGTTPHLVGLWNIHAGRTRPTRRRAQRSGSLHIQ